MKGIAWGNEIAQTQVQMFLEAVRDIFLVLFSVDVLFFLIWTSIKIGLHTLFAFYVRNIIRFGLPTLLGHGQSVAYLNGIPYTKAILFKAIWVELLSHYHRFVLYTLGIDAVLTAVMVVFFLKFTRRAKEEHVVRGRNLLPVKQVARRLPRPRRLPMLKGLNLPVSWETKHILVAGKTGTGKTTLISQMLQKLREDGEEKVIVYDFKGDYMQKFYRENIDRLFNPLDRRCVRWTVFNDIETDVDIAAVVESLIPPSRVDQERYWHDGAQAVLSAILKVLQRKNKKSNADIWETVSFSGTKLVAELEEYKQGKALQFLAGGENNQAAGVLSSLVQYAGIFEYLSKLDGDFSFRDWLNHDSGWLFITNTPRAQQLLRPALSMAVDLLSREILSLPDDKDRRIFLFLDEFATLQNLASIIDFITLSRSKGGVAVVGIQDLGRVQKLYGREQAKTIVNNMGNLILFAIEGETAEEFSRVLGEKEVSVGRVGYMFGPMRVRDGVTITNEQRIKKVLLPSELGMLREFEAICRLFEGQICRGKIERKFIPAQAQSFVLNDVAAGTTVPQEQGERGEILDV